jgi:hypothetical protein
MGALFANVMFTQADVEGHVAFCESAFCIISLFGYAVVMLYNAILNCEVAPFPLQYTDHMYAVQLTGGLPILNVFK